LSQHACCSAARTASKYRFRQLAFDSANTPHLGCSAMAPVPVRELAGAVLPARPARNEQLEQQG
jgi:hypothetical protein